VILLFLLPRGLDLLHLIIALRLLLLVDLISGQLALDLFSLI
jgi:hypothetical protein